MPHRGWKFRIADIVDSIEKILSYTAGMSFDQLCKDTKTIDAVIRNFTIIGEAARHIPDEHSMVGNGGSAKHHCS